MLDYVWIWRMIGVASILSSRRWFVSLDVSSKSHFLLEINLGELVALLSILDLLISLVNKVIASSDVVVPVVLNAFLSVLSVKVELLDNLLIELFLDRHFLLAGEESHVSVSIFYLQRPCVVSDFVHTESVLWICVQNSSDEVFALAREELGKGVLCSHDLLVQI